MSALLNGRERICSPIGAGAGITYIGITICASRQDTQSPGPYSILRELSLSGLVGLDTRRPPTL